MSTPALARSGYLASIAATASADKPSLRRYSFADADADAATTGRRTPPPRWEVGFDEEEKGAASLETAADVESIANRRDGEAEDEAKVGARTARIDVVDNVDDADADATLANRPLFDWQPPAAAVANRAALMVLE